MTECLHQNDIFLMAMSVQTQPLFWLFVQKIAFYVHEHVKKPSRLKLLSIGFYKL